MFDVVNTMRLPIRPRPLIPIERRLLFKAPSDVPSDPLSAPSARRSRAVSRAATGASRGPAGAVQQVCDRAGLRGSCMGSRVHGVTSAWVRAWGRHRYKEVMMKWYCMWRDGSPAGRCVMCEVWNGWMDRTVDPIVISTERQPSMSQSILNSSSHKRRTVHDPPCMTVHEPPCRNTGVLQKEVAVQSAITLGVALCFGPVACLVHLVSAAVAIFFMAMFDYMMHYGGCGGSIREADNPAKQ